MPKATLEFTLPEDRDAFEDAIKGDHYRRTLEELRNEIRSKIKHTDEKGSWQEAWDLFWEIVKGIE